MPRVVRRLSAAAGVLVLLAAAAAPAAAYPRPGQTERVSVSSGGTEGNDNSVTPAISADGRYVAFQSNASNLVDGDTNGTWDIFVHDRQTRTTERVSVASDGTQSNGLSVRPAISADGRHVAFQSNAANLVPDDTNGAADVFVHDRETGETERVSVASDGSEGDGASSGPAISADGRHVAFQSMASNIVDGDTNDAWDVFVHDRQTRTTERVSVASDGSQGNDGSFGPAISADGRHVAFHSHASNLVDDDTNGEMDVFVHDRQTRTTERVSMAADGAEANHESGGPSISADGRYVAFRSIASNLVPTQLNNCFGPCPDIFVRDRLVGTTERVSVASDGAEADGVSFLAVISADGRHVAFESNAANLVPDDTNDSTDVFVHDRETGATERVSVAFDGAESGGGSFFPFLAISGDGRHVAFESLASNLVPIDTNGRPDVFVRDRGPATGVGGMAVQEGADELIVSGWSTFSGETVASADDPPGEGMDVLGARITGASVVHRPEQDDLLLRLRLASLPEGGRPGVLYRWSFTIGGSAYEIRALRTTATALPLAGPYVGLHTCETLCEEVARLDGTIGTAGNEVRVSLPLEVLGAAEGATLTDVAVAAALGEATTGALVVLHEADLPDPVVSVPRVDLGVAPASTPADEVAFDTAAELVEGRFSATLDVSSLEAGDHRLWARACLGEVCGAGSVEVTL